MDFSSLDRKALQALAKEHGIKANLSNSKIMEELTTKIQAGNLTIDEEMTSLQDDQNNVETTTTVSMNKEVSDHDSIQVVVEVEVSSTSGNKKPLTPNDNKN
jgi:hypothetical protein